MASEKELAESQARSWYVSRNVSTGERDLDLGQILGEVHSPDGVSLEILEPVEVLPSANAGTKAFAAQLSVPGLIRAKLDVEVEVVPFHGEVVAIGLRPSDQALRYPISAKRYFNATWSILDSLEARLVDARMIEQPQAA
jgi:hypothetical protein